MDNAHIPANLLSILEQLNTFPTDPLELNSWWVQELGVKPPKSKSSAPNGTEVADETSDDDSDSPEDWRKFFSEDVTPKGVTQPTVPQMRLHQLTVHQSLHSLSAHRAVFTRAWLRLLPHLSVADDSTKKFSMRVLNIMHRGILPHLTKPVLVMDWVGACIDHGTSDFMQNLFL